MIKETSLRRFIQRRLPWPQHFDGKGWRTSLLCSMAFSSPDKWLVDKRGNLRDTNGRLTLSAASLHCSTSRFLRQMSLDEFTDC